jgi:hypothetical protein
MQLICVHLLDVEELVRRAARRGFETGRWVPEGVVREAHAKIPRVFNTLRGHVHSWQVVDASARRLVWEQDSQGTQQVHDADFVRKLLEVAE